uniref:Signal recognition particle-docking protein FtsY n=1 Tax=Caenorhabditis tropicalis TaxID=1561998 RepID=A0A1I7SZK6_9PELO
MSGFFSTFFNGFNKGSEKSVEKKMEVASTSADETIDENEFSFGENTEEIRTNITEDSFGVEDLSAVFYTEKLVKGMESIIEKFDNKPGSDQKQRTKESDAKPSEVRPKCIISIKDDKDSPVKQSDGGLKG